MATRNPLAYRSFLASARAKLASRPTSLAVTPFGPVRYVDEGSGPPIVLVHGIFGGYDAALRLAHPEVLAGHRLIAPSRFGYPGTPMPERATVAAQADAHAALLDALGVDRAVVYAGSAGGTSAIRTAIRHPDRVTALVLQSTNVPGPHHDHDVLPRAVAARLWRSDWLMWMARRYATGLIVDLMGVPKGLPLSVADRRRLDEELDAIFPLGPRIDGVLFDAYVGNRDINRNYPFEAITAPTLFVHFRDDGGPPYSAAVATCRRMPAARLVTGQHGGHLGLGEHPDITAAVQAFLREVEGARTA